MNNEEMTRTDTKVLSAIMHISTKNKFFKLDQSGFLKERLIPRYHSQTKQIKQDLECLMKKNKKSKLKLNMNLPYHRHWRDPVQETQRASESMLFPS